MNPITSFLVLACVLTGFALIAGKFVEAADFYAGHPAALQLRVMNIIYEATKERGATLLIPSSMVDGLNTVAATVALALSSNEMSESQVVPRKVAT